MFFFAKRLLTIYANVFPCGNAVMFQGKLFIEVHKWSPEPAGK